MKRFAAERKAFYLDALKCPREISLEEVLENVHEGVYVIDEFQELKLDGYAYRRLLR